MSDIPQPATEPYSPGDHVRIYLGPDDPDAQHHDTPCEVIDVITDNLDEETGREEDAYSYKLQDIETGEELPITFRHHDLVPEAEN